MNKFLDYLPLLIYAALFGALKLGECLVLVRPRANIRLGRGNLIVWLIFVPFWLVLLGPVLEFIILGCRPTVLEMVIGGLIFITASFISIKGFLDLQVGFIKAITSDETSMVVTGLYHTIRHPVALGNILFCIACPLFLGAGPSWIPALLGILAVIIRISIEECFMQEHLLDYQAYKERTWALIPFLY